MAVIRLSDEIVANLERLSYETNGLKVLHTHALEAEVNEDKIAEIRRLFLEKQEEYKLTAQETALACGAPCGAAWHIDFAEGVLTFGE